MAKKALVVGINNYSNWNNGVTIGGMSLSAPSLQWCVNDSNWFASLLRDGFCFDQVNTLQDTQATSLAILDGINGLLKSSTAGDTVCFYFSGHGGRFAEVDNSSRYYETIIPYDAAMISSKQIAAIAQGLLPSEINFTLVLDSCHSGGDVPLARGARLYLEQGGRAGVSGGMPDDRSLDLRARPLCVRRQCIGPDSAGFGFVHDDRGLFQRHVGRCQGDAAECVRLR